MKRSLIRFVLTLMVSWVWMTVHAQDTITLDAVNVTANQVATEALKPLVSRKVDSLVLENKSTAALSELLIQHSPVFIKTYGPGGVSTASFRGTTASHTLVLWNGFQLNAPTLGQVDFSTIPVFLADDIDLKWGSATSNNSGGLGGSVNIDSKTGFGKGLLLDLKQTYGSFNTLGSFLTAGYCGKNVSFRLKAYRNSSDNDFEYYNLGVLPHQWMRQRNADFVDFGLMPELSVMLQHGILSASSWNQWNNRNLPTIMPNVFNTSTEEWTRDNFSRNMLSYKLFWDSGSLQLKSAAFFENQRYYLNVWNPQTGGIVTGTDSQNRARVFHQIADAEQQVFAAWKVRGKLQWDHETVASNNYIDTKQRDVVSLYTAVEGTPTERLQVNLTVSLPAEAQEVVVLSNDLAGASGKVDGHSRHLAAQIADAENQFLRKIFLIFPHDPAHARIGQPVLVSGCGDGNDVIQSEIPLEFRFHERGEHTAAGAVDVDHEFRKVRMFFVVFSYQFI